MFCIKQQTVCLRDGMRITFKNAGFNKGQEIVEITDEHGVTHQLHFLKGGDVIRVETISLTGSMGSGREGVPIDAPHSPVGD